MQTPATTLTQIIESLGHVDSTNRQVIFAEEIFPALSDLRHSAGDNPSDVLTEEIVGPMEAWARMAATDASNWKKYVDRLIKYARHYRVLAQAQETGLMAGTRR
jgi:hypothetical protein